MATRNPTGYCPRCGQDVLLTREDIDWGIAILLLCFTGGIGLIIYLVIYYSKPQDRCIHCNTRILSGSSQYSQPSQKSQNQSITSKDIQKVEHFESEQPKYCPFCGEQLESSNVKFCSHCGTKI